MMRSFRFWFGIALLLWLASAVGSYLWGRRQLRVEIPPNLGNKPANIAALPKKCPFEFIVLGDPHNTATSEDLMGRIGQGRQDFIIILGDFVRNPELGRNRFFWDGIARAGISCPVFLVLGDDDVIRRGAQAPSPETIAQYEKWYGPRNFSFYAGDCLFILLFNITEVRDGQYLEFLEKALRERKAGTRHTFVCAHVPPHFSLPEARPEILEDDPRFFELLERFKVDYCLTGHEHGYWRGRRKGVDYIKLAGGGGRLPEKEGWGMFHHAMRFRVGEDLIAEDLMVVPRACGAIQKVRYFCWASAYPFWEAHIILFAAAVAVPGTILILLIGTRIWSRVRAGAGAESPLGHGEKGGRP